MLRVEEVARLHRLPLVGQLVVALVLEDPERGLTVGETIGTCEQIVRQQAEA